MAVTSAAALVVLTAVFDNVMIGMGVFEDAPAKTTGLRVGLAPIEDFSYSMACALALPPIWVRRRSGGMSGVSTRALAGGAAVVAAGQLDQYRLSRDAAKLLTTREVDWELVVGTLFFLIPYNLAMYGINDVFDYASDLANPRKGGIEGAVLSPRSHST